MAMLSIPSYKTDDPNYRYKMPRLIAKVEGRGNGIRTNITNMGDIARCLKRQPDYPTKFCGIELGTSSKFNPSEGKAIVNGSHEQKDLQDLIDKFIDKFVLCENCHLPEIDLLLKKGRVQYQCNACGQKGEVDNLHKLSTFILKNPPDGADSTMGVKASKKKKEEKVKSRPKTGTSGSLEEVLEGEEEKKKKKKEKSATEEVDVADGEKKSKKKSSKSKEEKEGKKSKKCDKETMEEEDDSKSTGSGDEAATTTGESLKKSEKKSKKSSSKKSSKKTDGTGSGNDEEIDDLVYDSPEIIDVISRLVYFLSGVSEKSLDKAEISSCVTPTMFSDQLRLLQRSQDFDNAMKVYVALEVLFSETFKGLTASSLDQRIKFLKPVTYNILPKDVLTALQDFMFLRGGSETVPEGFKGYAAVLYKFYDTDILSGDGILAFYSGKASSKKSSKQLPVENEAFVKAKEAATSILEWLAEPDDEEKPPRSNKTNKTPVIQATKSLGSVDTSGAAAGLKTVSHDDESEEDDDNSDLDIDNI